MRGCVCECDIECDLYPDLNERRTRSIGKAVELTSGWSDKLKDSGTKSRVVLTPVK